MEVLYQQYTEIHFNAWEEIRYRVTGKLYSRNQAAPAVFRVPTILEHGEYWPNRTRHSEDFQ